MKITFYSNFLNHHQLPFCEEMIKIIGEEFKFVATECIPEERKKLGYEDMNSKYNFVVKAYENQEEADLLSTASDVVIIGSAPDKYIKERLKKKKLTFRYSERIFKNGFNIKSFISLILRRTLMERNNVFLLCASAYASRDYNIAGAYINRTFKWGYFTKVTEYKNINSIMSRKKHNSIIWVGRFIEVKHPEVVVNVAKKLKDNNVQFSITMVGSGPLEEKIKLLIKENSLEDYMLLTGSIPYEKVRKLMEESEIMFFTSDRGEGWGAVVNEAMNSACSVIASHEIGSVPFLIDDNKNGIIYEDGNTNDLYNKATLLLSNSQLSRKLGIEAYNTMIKLWSPKIAADRFYNLSKSILNNKKIIEYKTGPCSKALTIKDNWYLFKGSE